jgi:hypothetical protein
LRESRSAQQKGLVVSLTPFPETGNLHSIILITPISLRLFLIVSVSSHLYSGSPKWSLSFRFSHRNFYNYFLCVLTCVSRTPAISSFFSFLSPPPISPPQIRIFSSAPCCSRAV